MCFLDHKIFINLKLQFSDLSFHYLLTFSPLISGLFMNYQASSPQKDFHSAISPEQFNQIIEAITDGRYSWACVLILRCIGYNPIHYIPQRTYSRLIKENRQLVPSGTSNQQKKNVDYRDSCQLISIIER
jgi:hypothetical protein